MKNLSIVLGVVFLCGYCISTYSQTIEHIPPKHINNSSNIHKPLSVQNSITKLKKYEGTYLIPAVNEGDSLYPPAFEEGEIIFKLINGKLIGICEQRILPMRGLMRTKIEVLTINANGVGKYKSSWENFDRWDNPNEKGEGLSGTIIFIDNRVKFMGYSCKKTHNLTSGTSDTVIISTNSSFICGTSTFIYGGQTYNTVQIGTQCIMKENLNIGTYVPSVLTGNWHSDVSNNGIIEKYCSNNDTANCAIYGGLYDWKEMMQYSTTEGIQGICPPGWHIPTDAEWTTLVSFLGGSSVAGGKMKETGFVHWLSPNSGATNQSGFTAFGASNRSYNGGFGDLQYTAYFWSSSQYNSSANAWCRAIAYTNADFSHNYIDKTYSFSLRCFKD